ncbi:MAG: HNH endonuclease signature motif containing protein [Thermoleophilia bacterium]
MTLSRSTPLRRTGGPSRRTPLHRTSSIARSQRLTAAPPERIWTEARAKCDREGCCRVCGRTPGELPPGHRLEAAHLIGREHDRPRPHPDVLGPPVGPLWVNPLAVVPLCTEHHTEFDGRRLDVLPFINFDEQAHAVSLVGIVAALRRLTSTRGTGAPE